MKLGQKTYRCVVFETNLENCRYVGIRTFVSE